MNRFAKSLFTTAAILCLGAAPQAIIEAPQDVQSGDLIVLKGGKSSFDGAKGLKWVAVGHKKQFIQYGPDLVTAIRDDGEYTFALIAAGVVNKEPEVDVATVTISIGGGGGDDDDDDDDDDPDPPDPPSPPDVPDGELGLTRHVYDLCKPVKKNDRQLLADMALSFRTVASQVAAGTLNGARNILDATKSSVDEVLINKRTAEIEGVRTKLSDRLYALYTEGKIDDDEEFAVAWRAIADGFAAAAVR